MSFYNDDYAQDYGEDHQKSYEQEDRQVSDYIESSDDQPDVERKQKQVNTDQQNPDNKSEQDKQQKNQLQSASEQEEQGNNLIDLIPEKRKQQLDLYDSFGGEDKVPNQERITSPFISKYEKAMIIGKRAQQISKNSPIYISISQEQLTQLTAIDIAQMQFELNKIPLIIRRFLPDKSFEDWKFSELKKLPF